MQVLADLFAKYPELAVFLCLGIGYWIGGIKFRGITLGGVTGSLIAGIAIGYGFEVPISKFAKSLVFLLFLFGIAYSVGPKFFKAIKGQGWKFGALGIFVPVVGLVVAVIVAKSLKLDPGFSAGLLSGGLTESPAMGTASEAIQNLAVDETIKQKWLAHVAVADALCYLFGALGVIWFCSALGPRLLGIDPKAEAARLEASYGIERTRSGVVSAWRPYELRSYRVTAATRAAGRPIAEVEGLVPESRLFIERVRRGGEILASRPDLVLEAGDLIAVGGKREILMQVLDPKAEEVDDRELLDVPVASHDVFVRNRALSGLTLAEIAKRESVRGVFLNRITRGNQEIPIGSGTTIEQGDVLNLVGPDRALERAAAELGEVVRPTEVTDFVAVGLAIFLGAAFGGLIVFPIGGVEVALGTSVGTLLAGVITGYLRSIRPIFGRVPDGAVAFMQSFGLAAFVAMVGLGAGPEFVTAIREAGLKLFLGGIVVTMIPQIAGLYFGKYVLRMNPILLLGGISGAQTFAPALAALQEKSGSSVAVLGYSGAVPVAHILLTTWGTILVLLIS